MTVFILPDNIIIDSNQEISRISSGSNERLNCDMSRFTYQYKGVVYESNMEHYMKDGEHRYRVMLPDGLQIVIAKFGMGLSEKIIWVESHKAIDEVIQPHDLVQAIGEGLEKHKLNRTD